MKFARKISTGEHFFECPRTLWATAIERSDRDSTAASPLPRGHKMFQTPTAYGVVCFEVPDADVEKALHR